MMLGTRWCGWQINDPARDAPYVVYVYMGDNQCFDAADVKVYVELLLALVLIRFTGFIALKDAAVNQ